MVIEEVRKKLSEDTLVFDNPAFDNSIIGTTFNGNAIYLFDKMVYEFIADSVQWDEVATPEEAIEFIEYNTIRALDYITDGLKPIILYTGDEDYE
jgi:hypothetical protein